MKIVRAIIKLKIPETLKECDILLNGEKGDDEYINYSSCAGCAYQQDENEDEYPCKHRAVLIALGNMGK